jgi:dipeptidyl aminopeptidase/acylaminoacyl peptidase
MQMLATRGYAVLFPDVPMHDGRPVQDVADAVLSGVNRVIDLGFADPERLAVMGQSFGGYNTMSILTQTTRFKAAVISGSATINAFQGYSEFENGSDVGTGYYEQGQGAMRATPWERPMRYLENSPSFFLDRVETPVMIVRGTTDTVSTMNGSIFNSLRRLGKTAEFLEYESEGHVIQQPRNIVDLWNRRIAWLDRYLREK